jgi:hypothetical protein
MINLFSRTAAKLTALIIVGAVIMLSGCSALKDEDFAIYLTRDNIPPAQMEPLSHVEIANQSVISAGDIITYNAQTHELKLTAEAFKRIAQLEVPVQGKSFIVCVGRKPVYWGAFWTPVSSISFDGVTIWKPYTLGGQHIVTLELGYPSSSFYGGEDPRNNAGVIKSLEKAGKLINNLSITAIDKLPHSMKGYELYSWLEDGRWRFTLITGTNRNKTLEEIVSNDDFISEAGWVDIHVAGMDAIKTVLGKLPQNESVLWLSGMREQTGQTDIKIQLPPEQIVNVIKEYARQCGLDFNVPTL